jgi:hypothetical protein
MRNEKDLISIDMVLHVCETQSYLVKYLLRRRYTTSITTGSSFRGYAMAISGTDIPPRSPIRGSASTKMVSLGIRMTPPLAIRSGRTHHLEIPDGLRRVTLAMEDHQMEMDPGMRVMKVIATRRIAHRATEVPNILHDSRKTNPAGTRHLIDEEHGLALLPDVPRLDALVPHEDQVALIGLLLPIPILIEKKVLAVPQGT